MSLLQQNEHDIPFMVDIICDLEVDSVPEDVAKDELLEDLN